MSEIKYAFFDIDNCLLIWRHDKNLDFSLSACVAGTSALDYKLGETFVTNPDITAAVLDLVEQGIYCYAVATTKSSLLSDKRKKLVQDNYNDQFTDVIGVGTDYDKLCLLNSFREHFNCGPDNILFVSSDMHTLLEAKSLGYETRTAIEIATTGTTSLAVD